MKKEKETNVHVTHIKVSEYIKCYFLMKYGNPVFIPESNPLSTILYTKMCENPTMKLLTGFAYSDMAFNYKMDGVVFDIEAATPDEDESQLFMPVVIPQRVLYGKTTTQTNSTWQLTKNGAIEFRKRCKREFWHALTEFMNECVIYAKARGEMVTAEAVISDFLIAYGIPMEHFDSIVRQERRMRTEYTKEIEKHRNFVEERSGSELLYT